MSNSPMNPKTKFALAIFVLFHTTGMLALAQQNPPPACAQCMEEEVGTKACGDGAGIECGHGPENDPDCATAYAQALIDHPNWTEDQIWKNICKEENGGNGNCNCYECGIVDTCEQYIVDLKAWCGNEGAGAPCVTHTEKVVPAQRIRYSFDSVILSGAACAATGGFHDQKDCGGTNTLCSCLGNANCVVVFGTYHEDTSRCMPKCGPRVKGKDCD